MTETRPTEPTGIDAPPSTPVKRGDKLKWARSLESRPLAVVDLEHVTVASWGELAPLAVTLQEVAGVYPMGWFDRVDAPPSSEEVVEKLPCPFVWELREFADDIADVTGDGAHMIRCSADVMQQMSDLLRRARQRLGPKCVPDADINLAILCDDIDALFSRPGWPSSATRAALPSTGIDELVEALERSERVLAEVFQYLDEEDGGGLLDRVDKARLDVSAALAKVRQP